MKSVTFLGNISTKSLIGSRQRLQHGQGLQHIMPRQKNTHTTRLNCLLPLESVSVAHCGGICSKSTDAPVAPQYARQFVAHFVGRAGLLKAALVKTNGALEHLVKTGHFSKRQRTCTPGVLTSSDDPSPRHSTFAIRSPNWCLNPSCDMVRCWEQ